MGMTSINVSTPVIVKTVNTQQNLISSPLAETGIGKEVAHKESSEPNFTKNQFSEKAWKDITEKLNQFMESMNTDINFVLHTKTNTLMVQVQDGKTHKVLKECPAHELLDTVARIKDCIGAFLDEKV